MLLPPELLHFLLGLGKIHQNSNASTFVLFFLCEIYEFESSPTFSITLFLLSFHFQIPKGFLDFCASAESSRTHSVVSPELFQVLRPLRDFVLLSSPTDGEIWMPSWLSLCSRNLLLSLLDVQQPCEDPSVDSSFNFQNSKSSLLFSVSVCTMSQCPLGRVSSHKMPSSSVLFSLCLSAHCLYTLLVECLLPELPAVLSPSVCPMRLLNAHLAELSKSLVILVS
jgi:hypothetical protein